MRVELTPSGLKVGEEVVPLFSGSVHYWRLDPRHWRAALDSLRAMGLRFVDVYVPWNVHEVAPGEFDFGERDPQRDVVGFLRTAHELGLLAIVRPGPHINGELTHFGIPERVVWDEACQARSPNGHPVILPAPPRMFPVPSYASEAYRAEVARYFEAVGRVLGPLRWPEGPIALLQIDNEGAMFFRDGAYDQDYHPDAVARFREFLAAKTPGGSFAEALPPVLFDATTPDGLAPHLEWAEFHEQLLADTFARFRGVLKGAGLDGIPTVHNLPLAQQTTPLNAARIVGAVDMVGLDYYGKASPGARRDIARRTSELAVHAAHAGFAPFACEMGAGFPPIFPPLEERDSLFTAMCALAYGLRGFNLYMAVDRDRWIGAPIDERGRPRPFAESWRKLVTALVEVRFHELRRRVPVRLVMPRVERRLARVMHAFGPVSGAVLAVVGRGPREGCLEDDLGLGYPIAIEAEAFLHSFEEALEARGIPYALVGGELKAAALEGAEWIVCATSGAMSGELTSLLEAARGTGVPVTVGPRAPTHDGAWRPVAAANRIDGFEFVERHDPVTVDDLVARRIDGLGLGRFACDPGFVFATVHEEASGFVRVAFVINPSDDDTVARVTVGVDAGWTDAIQGTEHVSRDGVVELRVRRHSVTLLVRARS